MNPSESSGTNFLGRRKPSKSKLSEFEKHSLRVCWSCNNHFDDDQTLLGRQPKYTARGIDPHGVIKCGNCGKSTQLELVHLNMLRKANASGPISALTYEVQQVAENLSNLFGLIDAHLNKGEQ